MAPYYLAKSLDTLRTQVNVAYPKRSKSSDGWIGDTAHSARKSDHNPNARGAVCALDLTHDPLSGFNAHMLAERLRVEGDPRLSYIISNKRIASAAYGWRWRTYSGANPHMKHAHFSAKQEKVHYDNPAPWKGVVATV